MPRKTKQSTESKQLQRRNKQGQPLEVGDRVKVMDTSNNRTRIGYVRTIDGTDIQVYVQRFDSLMKFSNGFTNLGRFKLLGRG
jgi:hypothetical protein